MQFSANRWEIDFENLFIVQVEGLSLADRNRTTGGIYLGDDNTRTIIPKVQRAIRKELPMWPFHIEARS